MINIERVSTGIVATPHNEDWQIEQLLPNLVFMGGDVRIVFKNPRGEFYTFDFLIEWYLEDVRVRSFYTDDDSAVISFDFNVNFEFDKMVIKHPEHDDVEICFKVVTETGTDIKKIDFFNVEDEDTALFWQYTRTSLYRGESLTIDGEPFVTQDGKIIPIEQDPITKYNVIFGGVSGMPVWQAESLNAKFGNADFIKIDGGIFQVETPPALTFLSDNLVNVTVGGYFTTEQYRGAPLLPIVIPNDEIDPIFNAWLNTNATYLNALLVEAPINPEVKFLNANRQWVEVQEENKAYKTEIIAAPANGTTLTLKTGVITVISTVLTSANSFTIAMPATPISGYINECGLKFKIGASLPTMTLPTIAYWRTPQYVPYINTNRVIILERETFDGTTWETYATCDKN